MEAVKLYLEQTKLARQQTFENLTIFPVLAPDGTALVANGRMLHLSAFKKEAGNGPAEVKYLRYSQRRRRQRQ